jgi:hypothetical protein
MDAGGRFRCFSLSEADGELGGGKSLGSEIDNDKGEGLGCC